MVLVAKIRTTSVEFRLDEFSSDPGIVIRRQRFQVLMDIETNQQIAASCPAECHGRFSGHLRADG